MIFFFISRSETEKLGERQTKGFSKRRREIALVSEDIMGLAVRRERRKERLELVVKHDRFSEDI